MAPASSIGAHRFSHPLVPYPRLHSLRLLLVAALAVPAACAFSSPLSTMSSPPPTTLGPAALRGLIQDASIGTQKESLDLGGIVWLEHLNLVVGDMEIAKKFYVDFLGLSQDGNPKHVNLGQQQFHLAANGDPPQRVTGSIGLTVPNLQRIRNRAGDATLQLEGTLFSIANNGDEKTMTVTCPWGNIFHLYDISIDDDHPCTDEGSQSAQKMVKMHGEGGVYGAHRMAVRGGPGIRFVEIACRPGTAARIAEFYRKVLQCHVTCAKADATTDGEVDAAIVSVGPGVHLAFVENEQLSDDVTKRMVGVHACIYIPTFQQTYNTLKERDLIWTNPRFTHLDSCDTWDEAQASRTFRFKDVLDVDSGEKLLELEHETRPMTHGQYLRVPQYVPN